MVETEDNNNKVTAVNNNNNDFSSPTKPMKKIMMVRKQPMQRSVSDGDANSTSVRSIYSSGSVATSSSVSTDTNGSPNGSPIQRVMVVRKKEKMAVPPKSPFRHVGKVGNDMLKLISTPIRKVKKAAVMKLFMDGLSTDFDDNSNKNDHTDQSDSNRSPTASSSRFEEDHIIGEQQLKKKKVIIKKKIIMTKQPKIDKKQKIIDLMEKKIDEIDLLALDIEEELNLLNKNKEEKEKKTNIGTDSPVSVDTELTVTTSSDDNNDEQKEYLQNRLLLIEKIQNELHTLERKVDKDIIMKPNDILYELQIIMKQLAIKSNNMNDNDETSTKDHEDDNGSDISDNNNKGKIVLQSKSMNNIPHILCDDNDDDNDDDHENNNDSNIATINNDNSNNHEFISPTEDINNITTRSRRAYSDDGLVELLT